MKLSVYHNSKDYSLKVDDFQNPLVSFDLTTGKLNIGYYKPIKNIFIELKKRTVLVGEEGSEVEQDVEDEIDLKHFNGTEFVDPQSIQDYTFGLTRSGLISWNNSDGKVTTLNGREMYWLELTTKTPALVEISGINLVLSNDRDLLSFFPSLYSHLPDDRKSFIGFHQEARDQIVQYIQNSGKVIKDYNIKSGEIKSIDQFDLVDIAEFRQASKYKTLELIFRWLSRDNDDQYFSNAEGFRKDYISSLNSRLMTIDINNDGKTGKTELNTIQTVVITNA